MYNYTDKDKHDLLTMTDREVRRHIRNAKDTMEEYIEYYNKQEKLLKEESPLLDLDLGILFRVLTNTEGYIRFAENLLEEWDDNRYINKKRVDRLKLIDLVKIKSNTDVGEKTEPKKRDRVSKSVLNIRVIKI